MLCIGKRKSISISNPLLFGKNMNTKEFYMTKHEATMKERFWRQVEKRGEDECWIWLGANAQIRESNQGRKVPAHRYSYELHKDLVPAGVDVRRNCENLKCVNPKHLFLKSRAIPLEERFWQNVDKKGEDECWLWTAGCSSHGGYGRTTLNGKEVQTHRYSYELHHGPVPEEMEVRHSCSKPHCVNPGHLFIEPSKVPIEERFWEKVNKKGEEECWEWTASLDDKGYGQLFVDWNVKRPVAVHRLSYELHKGPIPEGLLVRHKCHNSKCVNPNHLETGTQKDNMEDAVEAGRNTYGDKNGMASLTNEQVREIKNMLNNGVKGRYIAKKFCVSEVVISNIKTGKTWFRVI